MFLIKKRVSSDDGHIKLIAYTIILYISSLFAPLVIVASYQSLIYYSKKQWFFATPFSAYATFGGSMIFIAIVLTIYLIFRDRWSRTILTRATWVLILLTIPAFFLSLTNYYYFDQKGIHYNGLIELQQRDYKWSNVTKVHMLYRNHQGTTGFYQYKFDMNDGKTITIPIDGKILNNYQENKRRIEGAIKENNIPLTDNFKNPISD